MNKFSLRCLLATCSLVIFGCVNQPQQPGATPAVIPDQPAVYEEQQPDVEAPVPVVITPALPTTAPAVESLTKQARAQYLSRDYQGAIATAERGLRIDRRAADLYLVMAQSYIQLASPQKASMFVQQGLRYAQQGSEVALGLLRAQEIVMQSH